MSLIRRVKPRDEKVYVNWEHGYLVNGVDFYVMHKIPFCVGENIKFPCSIYKFEGKRNDNNSNSS